MLTPRSVMALGMQPRLRSGRAATTTSPRVAPPGRRAGRAAPASSDAAGPPPGERRRRVVILPGLLNNTEDYAPMAALLRDKYGHEVTTVRVARADWLRNASGVVTPEYWTGTLRPLPTVAWYCDRIDEAVGGGEGEGVVLIAHSAGGWLGRLWMDAYSGAARVSKYISLGSPQLAAPEGSDAFDQTRGILTFINRELPGAYHADVEYVTVSGRWRRGAASLREGSLSDLFIGLTYKQTCGAADVDGDGITPVPIAHLEGSEKVVVDDCYHSPVGSEPGSGRRWYGSEEMLAQWVSHVSS